MSNIQHIKIYDDFITDNTVENISNSYKNSTKDHSNFHAFITDDSLDEISVHTWKGYDDLVFESFNKAYLSYITDYPNTVGNYTTELQDIGYHFRTADETIASDVTGLYDCAKVIKMIMFLDDNVDIEFPLDNLLVGGKVGRILVFPSSWNLKYKLISKNENDVIVIESSMIYCK